MFKSKVLLLIILHIGTIYVSGKGCNIEKISYNFEKVRYTYQYFRLLCAISCRNIETQYVKWFYNDTFVSEVNVWDNDDGIFRYFFPANLNDTGKYKCEIYDESRVKHASYTVNFKVIDFIDSSYQKISQHLLPKNNHPHQYYWMPTMSLVKLNQVIRDDHRLELSCLFYAVNVNFKLNVTANWYHYKPGNAIYDTFLGNWVKPNLYKVFEQPVIETYFIMCQSDDLMPKFMKNYALYHRITCFKSILTIKKPTNKSAGHYTCLPNVYSHIDLTLTSQYVTYSVSTPRKPVVDLKKFEFFKKTNNNSFVEVVCRINVGNDSLKLGLPKNSKTIYNRKKLNMATGIIDFSKFTKPIRVSCQSRHFGNKFLILDPVNLMKNVQSFDYASSTVNPLIRSLNSEQRSFKLTKQLYMTGIIIILSMLLLSFIVMYCCRARTRKRFKKIESTKKENLDRMLNFNYWLTNKDYMNHYHKSGTKYTSVNNTDDGNNNRNNSVLSDDYDDSNTEYGQIIFVDNFSDVDNKAYDDAGDEVIVKKNQRKYKYSTDNEDEVFTNDTQTNTSIMLTEPRRRRRRTYSSNVYVTDTLIGQGEFGKVYRGSVVLKRQDSLYNNSDFSSVSSNSVTHYINTPNSNEACHDKDYINNYYNYKSLSKLSVAIKISQTQHGLQMLKNEAHILSLIASNNKSNDNNTNTPLNHHIIQLIKIVQDPFMLIVELAPMGNLKDFLTNHNPLINKDSERLADGKLVLYCQQLVKALDYLASLSIIHRDIAARNVLLVNENLIKLSDFGLSKHGSTYVDKSVKFCGPIRHMAPECFQRSLYSSSSDVWAFGITVWEIYNLGAIPYHLCFDNLSVERAVCNGVINEHSNRTPNSMRILMNRCWDMKCDLRPSFSTIHDQLKDVCVSEYLEPLV